MKPGHLLCLLGAISSCARPDPSAGEIIRGHATFGPEVRALRPCGSAESLWIVDRSGLLENLHAELTAGRPPYEAIFVEVRASAAAPAAKGTGSDYTGQLNVESVRYAAAEARCDADWEEFELRARGNEPFWSVAVTGRTIRMRVMGRGERQWGVRTRAVGEVSLFLRGEERRLGSIELLFHERPCRDSMSGAYHHLTVTALSGGRLYTGCGFERNMTLDGARPRTWGEDTQLGVADLYPKQGAGVHYDILEVLVEGDHAAALVSERRKRGDEAGVQADVERLHYLFLERDSEGNWTPILDRMLNPSEEDR